MNAPYSKKTSRSTVGGYFPQKQPYAIEVIRRTFLRSIERGILEVSIYYSSSELADLDRQCEYCDIFYLYGQVNKALTICRSFGRRRFTGDHDVWARLAHMLFLRARICRQRNRLAEWRRCMKRIRKIEGYSYGLLVSRLEDSRNGVKEFRSNPDIEMRMVTQIGLFFSLYVLIEVALWEGFDVDAYEEEVKSNAESFLTLTIPMVDSIAMGMSI